MAQDDSGLVAWHRLSLPSSIVDRCNAEIAKRNAEGPRRAPLQGAASGPLERTTSVHGLHGAEVERCSDAIHLMALRCQKRRSGLWWITTNKGTSREVISAIGKRITKLQRRYDLPAFSMTVLETRSELHAHIVFVANSAIALRLSKSKTFAGTVAVARVSDREGLARKYLVKERTPQAGYRRQHVLGGRISGSHRLEGGGDRVRLSRDLESEGIAGGFIKPWKHSNARRSQERKPYRSVGRSALAARPKPIAMAFSGEPEQLAKKVGEVDIWDDLLHAFA